MNAQRVGVVPDDAARFLPHTRKDSFYILAMGKNRRRRLITGIPMFMKGGKWIHCIRYTKKNSLHDVFFQTRNFILKLFICKKLEQPQLYRFSYGFTLSDLVVEIHQCKDEPQDLTLVYAKKHKRSVDVCHWRIRKLIDSLP